MDDGFSHDSDFLIWTERQARALRALAPRRADLPNELDLENLAEEIEGQLHYVREWGAKFVVCVPRLEIT